MRAVIDQIDARINAPVDHLAELRNAGVPGTGRASGEVSRASGQALDSLAARWLRAREAHHDCGTAGGKSRRVPPQVRSYAVPPGEKLDARVSLPPVRFEIERQCGGCRSRDHC